MEVLQSLINDQKLNPTDARTIINELMSTLATVQDKGQIRTGKLKLKILGLASRHYLTEMEDYARTLRIELLRTIQIKAGADSSVSFFVKFKRNRKPNR